MSENYTARFDAIDAELAEIRAAQRAGAGAINPDDYPLAGGRFSLPNEAGLVKWIHAEQKYLELGPTRTVEVPTIDGPPLVYVVARPVGYCWAVDHPEVLAAIPNQKVRDHIEWVAQNAGFLQPNNSNFDYDLTTRIPGWSFKLVDVRGEVPSDRLERHMVACYDQRDTNQALGGSTTWDAFGKGVPMPA